jgi:hypothetical protein
MLVQLGLSKQEAPIADRAEAMEILSGLGPPATRLALDQLRVLHTWQTLNSPEIKVKS